MLLLSHPVNLLLLGIFEKRHRRGMDAQRIGLGGVCRRMAVHLVGFETLYLLWEIVVSFNCEAVCTL